MTTPPLLRLAGMNPSVHRQVGISYRRRVAFVDEGLADLIRALWVAGIDTDYSCQGGLNPLWGQQGTAGYVAFEDASAGRRLSTMLPADLAARLTWERRVVRFQPEEISGLVAALTLAGR
ncbi:hypothetical protein [Frankia sp. AiPs1]|uniref:hypothetical protein n=1 Tax=Frankia sp. AiPs1 TaxID=573493 RepID=UPI0020444469|nr:hypothetical protein [Frankia sp. AiPs1]